MKIITPPVTNHRRYSQRGFTLIETLIALSLLAIISVMSFQAIEVVINADERSRIEGVGRLLRFREPGKLFIEI